MEASGKVDLFFLLIDGGCLDAGKEDGDDLAIFV
jgi:hypothetical protein